MAQAALLRRTRAEPATRRRRGVALPAAPLPCTDRAQNQRAACSSSDCALRGRAARARGAQRPARQLDQQAARRPPGEPRAGDVHVARRRQRRPDRRGQGRGQRRSPRARRPSARPSVSSWLASESVAIAHSGRSRIRPASATAPMTARQRLPELRAPDRRPAPSTPPRPAARRASSATDGVGQPRRERDAGDQPGERRRQQHRRRRVPPHGRGHPRSPCPRSRARGQHLRRPRRVGRAASPGTTSARRRQRPARAPPRPGCGPRPRPAHRRRHGASLPTALRHVATGETRTGRDPYGVVRATPRRRPRATPDTGGSA